jgi:hypothetical protein
LIDAAAKELRPPYSPRIHAEGPRATEQLIRATQDTARLDAWLDNFPTAQPLAHVGIAAQPEGEKGTG